MAAEEVKSFIIGQSDYLLFLHGLAFALMAAVCFALHRVERSGLHWRALAVFAMAWGTTEWLEMIMLGMDAGPVLPMAQMFLALVAVIARVEFARTGTKALGGPDLGIWPTLGLSLLGVSGVFWGTRGLWISLDMAAALAAFWGIFILSRYRSSHHAGSLPLLITIAAMGFYALGTAIPFIHINWYLPSLSGSYPEGQLLWILAAGLMVLGLMVHHRTLWGVQFKGCPVFPSRAEHWRVFGATLLILAAGWLAAAWSSNLVEEREKDDLLLHARIAANALNLDLIRQLGGTARDLESEAFLRSQRKISAMAKADPDIRSIYSLVERDGGFFYILDSGSMSSHEFSPPGSPFTEIPQGLDQVFSSRQPAVLGPFPGSRGAFVSALVPVQDPTSGDVLQVLGIDSAFSILYSRVASQRLVFILLTMLVTLLQVVAFTFRQIGREADLVLEDERKRFEAQVMESQKLESLGVLAGGIAHDFNNLLQGIIGNTDLAIKSGDAGPVARAKLEKIRSSSRRAAELCKLMLAYSGKGSFDVAKLDLGSILNEMATILEASIPKNVAVVCEAGEDLPAVEGDAAQIRQVVMNLILNAAEAIGDGSGTITTRAVRVDRPVGKGVSPPHGRCVLLEIADTGCGIDKTIQSRIFEPFFSTKFSGRGLGLAAVQGIVRGHGGAIAIDSAPGKGTIFKIYFPACPEPVRPAEKLATHRPIKDFHGMILLVDDEEDIREVGAGMLEYLGFRVKTCADGHTAIELLDNEGPFEAVLLDMTMPEIDGAETLRRIRKRHAGIPVVLVSGYDELDLGRKFSLEGMAGFLHKPFSLESLEKAMVSALGTQ